MLGKNLIEDLDCTCSTVVRINRDIYPNLKEGDRDRNKYNKVTISTLQLQKKRKLQIVYWESSMSVFQLNAITYLLTIDINKRMMQFKNNIKT